MTYVLGKGRRDLEKQKLIGEFQKNSWQTVRVSESEINDHPFIDIRIWATGKNGEPVPTQKGVAIHPELAPRLIALLQKAAVHE
jgi:hypothetical protein